MTSTVVWLPIGVRSLNAREHWRKKASRVKAEKNITSICLLSHPVFPAGIPTSVEMRRYGVRLLDDDNLTGACKHVRDAVAAFFSVDDGPHGPITWSTSQAVIRKVTADDVGVELLMVWSQQNPEDG